MCGRFVFCSTMQVIVDEFDVGQPLFDFKPSYNIAPSQTIITIYNDGENRPMRCRWGFIPSWAKNASIGNKMINARAETVADKSAFKAAFKKRRCLILSDGFYEWRKAGRIKIPVYIHLKSGRPFGFAGLYNPWTSPTGEQIYTCTIITTNANGLIKPFHNRMPAIIPKDKRSFWLDPDSRNEEHMLTLLEPFASDKMKAYDVSTLVNSPSNNSPENIKPTESHST